MTRGRALRVAGLVCALAGAALGAGAGAPVAVASTDVSAHASASAGAAVSNTTGGAVVATAHASGGPPGGLSPYRAAPDATPVTGTSSSAGGPRLRPGTYADTISVGEKKYYRAVLDDRTNAYISAVLAPPPGSEVQPGDGVRVTLESADGVKCSVSNEVTFGSVTSRPIADYATRRIAEGRECQSAGDYLFSVEWLGTGAGSGPGERGWPVELKYMSEPGLRAGAVVEPAPTSWSTRPRKPVGGPARSVSGGSGFNDAPAVGHGLWQDELRPGESRFYKVPVDWGQQLFLDAEFANAPVGQPSVVPGGLRLSLFNTARGFVRSTETDYVGKPTTVSLATAPVAFANRTSAADDTGAMRFSGWYYVRVSLDQRVDSALPVTLHTGVEGEPRPGPAYVGDATTAGFGITDEAREAAADGRIEDGGGNAVLMRTVGYGGIGLGSVLLLGLGAWTALARRGAGRTEPVAPVPWETRTY